jgi:glycosyltransferase involved in cell wall biosynthesis
MHVCLVTENHAAAVMGGAEYQTQLLAEELSRRPGVAVTYLARRVPSGDDARTLPYTVRAIGNSAGIRRRAVFFDAGNLRQALEELQPDVIYQRAKQSYTAVCARYALRAGVPFFFHVAHDFDLSHHRWITLRFSPNTPFDIVESLAGDWGIRHASHVIVQSARQGKLLQRSFGRTPDIVVRNFQPLPPSLPNKPEGPLQILWVGNLKDFKRPALFVELAQSFSQRRDLVFVMVGRPTALRRFKPLMARLSQTPNLRYLGELPLQRVNELMAAAALYVNTSTFEGSPNTFLQAWARGAVVASLTVDPDEEGSETLRIGYRAGSMQRLHAIVDELSRDPEKRRAVAQRAFSFVQQMHGLAHGARLADVMLAAARDAIRSGVAA